MIEYLLLVGSLALLGASFGFGVYAGVSHVGTMSRLGFGPERPSWAQEPVDAFNRAVGRPVEADPPDVEDACDSPSERSERPAENRGSTGDGPATDPESDDADREGSS